MLYRISDKKVNVNDVAKVIFILIFLKPYDQNKGLVQDSLNANQTFTVTRTQKRILLTPSAYCSYRGSKHISIYRSALGE